MVVLLTNVKTVCHKLLIAPDMPTVHFSIHVKTTTLKDTTFGAIR